MCLAMSVLNCRNVCERALPQAPGCPAARVGVLTAYRSAVPRHTPFDSRSPASTGALAKGCHHKQAVQAGKQSRVIAAAAATDLLAATANSPVNRFYQALSTQDPGAISNSLSPYVAYENLAVQGSLSGREAVTRFYLDSLAAAPEGAYFQIDQSTVSGNGSSSRVDSCNVGVVWRLILTDGFTVVTRGITMYALDSKGLISNVVECPEHPVKMSQTGLSLMAPLLRNVGGPLLPAVRQVGRTIQDGVDSLLQPLSTLTSPSSADTSSYYISNSSSSNAASAGSSGWSDSMTSNGGLVSNSSGSSSSAGSDTSQSFPSRMPHVVTAATMPAPTTAPIHKPVRPVAAAATGSNAGNIASTNGSGSHSSAPVQEVDLSGLWVKDRDRSDMAGYEEALDVLGLSSMQKVTARLIDGIEIKQAPNHFTVNFVTVVPFFKVTEKVALDGGSSQLNRRDLRSGKQTATATSVPGGVLVDMRWGAPVQGSLSEQYSLEPDGCLRVYAETRVGERLVASHTIYKRSKGSKEALLADSQKRNGSFTDVMRRQN